MARNGYLQVVERTCGAGVSSEAALEDVEGGRGAAETPGTRSSGGKGCISRSHLLGEQPGQVAEWLSVQRQRGKGREGNRRVAGGFAAEILGSPTRDDQSPAASDRSRNGRCDHDRHGLRRQLVFRGK